MSRYAVNSLLYRLKKDGAFRARFNADPGGALADLDLTGDERAAFLARDMGRINALGGYLHLVMSVPGMAAHVTHTDPEEKEREMANRKGTGLLMVWTDVPADKEPDFNRWYNEEHLAERLAIPGFLSAARYEAVKGSPKHLAYYELESADVIQSDAYKKVAAKPTEWTKRSGPGAVATTFIRNVYSMIHPRSLPAKVATSGMAPALQIGRMDVPPEIDADFNEWYHTISIPNYEKVPGVIRGRRYRAVEGTPTYRTLYEFEHPKVSESQEWATQQSASPVSARIRPDMRHAPGSPGVYVKTFELGAR